LAQHAEEEILFNKVRKKSSVYLDLSHSLTLSLSLSLPPSLSLLARARGTRAREGFKRKQNPKDRRQEDCSNLLIRHASEEKTGTRLQRSLLTLVQVSFDTSIGLF